MCGLRGVIHELYRCGKKVVIIEPSSSPVGYNETLRLLIWNIKCFFCISVLNSRKACTEYYSSLEKQVGFDERFEFEAPCHISISKLKQFPDRVWSEIENMEYRWRLVQVWSVSHLLVEMNTPSRKFWEVPLHPLPHSLFLLPMGVDDRKHTRLAHNTRQEIIYRISNLRRNIPD